MAEGVISGLDACLLVLQKLKMSPSVTKITKAPNMVLMVDSLKFGDFRIFLMSLSTYFVFSFPGRDRANSRVAGTLGLSGTYYMRPHKINSHFVICLRVGGLRSVYNVLVYGLVV